MESRLMAKTYEETVEWLYALEKAKGMDFKLERVASAFRVLGDPQDRVRCLHVAGTNGKGSVVAYLSAMLTAAGYRVGSYTSPHLVDLTERICIGGNPIGRCEVVALADEVRRRVEGAGIGLTFFEVLTAMAFLYFERRGVDCAAIEVGLGGRLDATNLVDPMVAVITSIGMDHSIYLGETESEIAAEKAGIVKDARPVVVGRVGTAAARTIAATAAAREAPLFRLDADFSVATDRGGRCEFHGMGRHLAQLELGLRGSHQRDNAAVAVAALAVVSSSMEVSDAAIRSGLRDVRWRGRLETVLGDPPMILDGAHNVDAMQTVVEELPHLASRGGVHVLFAAMGDKDWPHMIEILAPHCSTAVVTEVLPDRAVAVEHLGRAFRRYCPVQEIAAVRQALGRVRRVAASGDTVLVTGSLFLVGKVCELLDATPGSPG